jgi:hypothetical protein
MNSNFKSDRLLLILSAPVLLGWLFLMPRAFTGAPEERAPTEVVGLQDLQVSGYARIEAQHDPGEDEDSRM